MFFTVGYGYTYNVNVNVNTMFTLRLWSSFMVANISKHFPPQPSL